MKIFDRKGRLKIPEQNLSAQKPITSNEILKECYCPKGHSLFVNNIKFNNLLAPSLIIKKKKLTATLILNPVCGEKSRVTLGNQVYIDEIWSFHCPECEVELPNYAPCVCGGDLKILFCTPQTDYYHFTGICNRAGCTNAVIKKGDELYTCRG